MTTTPDTLRPGKYLLTQSGRWPDVIEWTGERWRTFHNNDVPDPRTLGYTIHSLEGLLAKSAVHAQMLAELYHLLRLLSPLEEAGNLNVPGLATLNGLRAVIIAAKEATPQGEEKP